MRERLTAIAFRLCVLTAVWLFGTATFGFAQETTTTGPPETPPATTPPTDPGTEPPAEPAPAADPFAGLIPQAGATTEEEAEEAEEAGPLVVPDVRGLPYVFAKGILEDAGFAWKVKGKVEGYLANLVAGQNPTPGSEVLDTGFPTVLLTLEQNPDYEERGLPEKTSPYPGTKAVVLASPPAGSAEDGATGDDGQAAGGPTGAEEAGGAGSQAAGKGDGGEPAAGEAEANARPTAFVVPGAPEEPLDEMPLPRRAKKLLDRVQQASSLTPELTEHWEYQHAWIVTGASYGWWRGAEALRILIQVDEYMQERFGVGASSEEIARTALVEVQALSES